MSFASDVRAEIARQACQEKCCARSEFAAALLATGGIAFLGKGRYSLALLTEDAPVVRHFFALLKRFFGVSCQIRTLKAGRLSGRIRYQLIVPEEEVAMLLGEMQLLNEGALFGVSSVPADSLFRYSCCQSAFLRGAFLVCGAVNSPEREYHMEFAAPNEDFASLVKKILIYFEIHAKINSRKSKSVVYLKKSEQISDALSILGASSAVLTFEAVCVKNDMSNYLNRQMNCDSFNIKRTMLSAEERLADIRYVDEQIGLDKLPPALRETAEARLDNPSASLAALSDLIAPPIGKSGVNARLRKISDIARRLRSGEEVEL